MRIQTNRKRGVKVVSSLMELYTGGLPPFDRHDAVLPQDPAHMPPGLELGGVSHRMFLFTINYYMRGGVDSNTAVKMLSQVFTVRPELFDPYFVVREVQPTELQGVLESAGLNYSKTRVPEFWIENAKRLVERYDGDPGHIFDSVTTYKEACRRIQNDHKGGGFKGFQKKMVSMLIYFFMDASFIDPFNFPIPVDLHVFRITTSNKIVTLPGYPKGYNLVLDERVWDRVRDFYMWYAVEHQVNPLDLCNAVWMYSRLRCADNPENEWEEEPYTGENRGRVIWKKPVDYTDPATFARWRRSCCICPISDTCELNGPSKPYYVHGKFKLDDPRVGPPADLQEQIGMLWSPAEEAAYSRDRYSEPAPAEPVSHTSQQLELLPNPD